VSFDTYQLALLRDDHDFRLSINREYRNNFSSLLSRLHVDDALAAARLQAIGRDRSLLAVTLLGNGEHLLGVVCRNRTDRNHIIVRAQVNAAHAAGRPAHWSYILLIKSDRQTIMRGNENALRTVC